MKHLLVCPSGLDFVSTRFCKFDLQSPLPYPETWLLLTYNSLLQQPQPGPLPSNSFETNSREKHPRLLPVFLKSADWFCTWKPCGLPSPTRDLSRCIPLWVFSPSCFCLSPNIMHLLRSSVPLALWLECFLSDLWYFLFNSLTFSNLCLCPIYSHNPVKFYILSQRLVCILREVWITCRDELSLECTESSWVGRGVWRYLDFLGPLWDLGFLALVWDSDSVAWYCYLS